MDDLHNKQAIQIAIEAKETHPTIFVWATIWLHPCEVSFWKITSWLEIEKEMEKLRTLYQEHKPTICAIGECWIDSFHNRDKWIKEIQTELLIEQCLFARTVWLPVVIHSRSNYPLTHEILKEFTDLHIYLHCRWYWIEELQQAIETFPHLWIWFCWNLTYPKATNIQETLSFLLDHIDTNTERDHHILLETDAPYLSPQLVRWTKNNPSHSIHIYDRVSANHPNTDIKTLTKESFKKLYTG